MNIRVDPLPVSDYRGAYVVLVDVLRAGTLAPILFDNSLQALTMTSSIREARLHREDGVRLIGEREGVPPEGFNHTASPSQLRRHDFAGSTAVLVSENAPRALAQVAESADTVLLASLYNTRAVVAQVLVDSPEHVMIVCSGHLGQQDLDDTLAAGLLVGALRTELPDSEISGAGRFAATLLKAFPEPLEALWLSTAGQELRRIEGSADLAVASLVSQSHSVPRLVGWQAGRYAPLHRFKSSEGSGP